jgi:hypothetical protein
VRADLEELHEAAPPTVVLPPEISNPLHFLMCNRIRHDRYRRNVTRGGVVEDCVILRDRDMADPGRNLLERPQQSGSPEDAGQDRSLSGIEVVSWEAV